MKIAQSNVNLVSSHTYYEENTVTIQSGVVSRGSFLENLQKQEKTEAEDEGDGGKTIRGNADIGIKRFETILGSENYNDLRPTKTLSYETTHDSLVEQISQIRARLLETLMEFLQLFGGGSYKREFSDMLGQTSSMISDVGMVKVTTIEMTHYEEEATTFSGKGMALTEDGRTIDFNVDFSLSRRLVQTAGISMAGAVSFIDPLVINVGSDVTSISDQSFFFDLDCDGQEDKIAGLGAGTGFLAYDRNGDGVINDGSELFGTKSGNGFADLAEFDNDNNGWIDENDEVYGKLQVWLRGEDGVDRLLSLKEADVGAIYLGNAETEHSMYAMPGLAGQAGFGLASQTGSRLGTGSQDLAVGSEMLDMPALAAMMRSSGIFLRESGGVGTVHQVDLARV